MAEPLEPGRLAATFARHRETGRRAFIPYLTAGDPDPDTTVDTMAALAEAGADVLELGIPFSDPLADGPTIQAATWRALRRGVTIDSVLAWTRRFAGSSSVPVVLFSYLNPILRYGPEAFIRDAADSGAAGLLLTDLPVGEDGDLEATLAGGALELVRLVAPTTRGPRLARVLDAAQGFVYYISRTGVTGETATIRRDLEAEIKALRTQTDLPIAVGFGISSPDQARLVATVADGVVMGSAIVRTLAESGITGAAKLASEIRRAIDSAQAPDEKKG